AQIRIGIPRILGMYSLGPWFTAWFESLGLLPRNLVWSDHTSDALFKAGVKRGAIDPCFPSKIGISHVHDLLYGRCAQERPLDFIFFPMIDSLPTFLEGVVDSRSCPTVTTTPEAVKAAWTHLSAAGLRLQRHARRVLDELEATDRIGLVLLSRPYHHDPGVCHDI